MSRSTIAHVPPVPAVHVHVPLTAPTGSASVTRTPDADDGPALLTTIVYVVGLPGATEVTPSVLVTEMSTCGVRSITAVAVSSAVL